MILFCVFLERIANEGNREPALRHQRRLVELIEDFEQRMQIPWHAFQQVLGRLQRQLQAALRRAQLQRFDAARVVELAQLINDAGRGPRTPILQQPSALARRCGCGKYQAVAEVAGLVEQTEQRPLPRQVAGHRVHIIDAQHGRAFVNPASASGGNASERFSGKYAAASPAAAHMACSK
jgi:hypothetical protein